MNNPRTLLFAGVLVLSPSLARSQARPTPAYTPPDSAQTMAMMAASQRMMHPATFVLGAKSELGLTPEQVSFLEHLVVVQKDSANARQVRMIAQARDQALSGANSAMAAAYAWNGPVDEKAIREQACAQSAQTADISIALINDRHTVSAALTPEQLRRLPMLEAQAMMSALQRPK